MSFLKNIFGKKESPLQSYADFWEWFQKNEKAFSFAVKQRDNIEKNFFNKLAPKLEEIKGGIYYLTGMFDKETVELILTAEGNPKNIVFVEELVNAAPVLAGWKFTALKPAMDISDVNIEMAGYKFNTENLNFYANELAEYPDEIDITIVHDDFDEESESKISNGTYIFLDNYLGELEFATTIDNLSFSSKKAAKKELVSIAKLKDFLIWREKEFIEKYEGLRHDTENDTYTAFEAQLENGNPLVAIMNAELLNWDSKASHPWMLKIEFEYNGKSTNGMPNGTVSNLMNDLEEKVMEELKDADGYLNIGRQTGDNKRVVYFACKEFRKPAKVLFQIQKTGSKNVNMEYNIFKDKYWQSVERFAQ